MDTAFPPDDYSFGGKAMNKNGELNALTRTIPRDNEVTSRTYRHRGQPLIIRRIGVNTEFAPLGRASGIVALGVDTPEAAILAVTLPGNDEVAGRVHTYRGVNLVAGG